MRGSNGSLDVTFRVTEGPRCRVRSIDVTEVDELGQAHAQLLGAAEPIRTRMLAFAGEWLARRDLAGEIRALTRTYEDAGFAFVEVTPVTTVIDDGHAMDVRIEIRRGAAATFGSVAIMPSSAEGFVRPALRSHGVDAGAPFSRSNLDAARRAIMVSTDARVDLSSTQDANDKTKVNVSVEIGTAR